jgi:hypothetical protein
MNGVEQFNRKPERMQRLHGLLSFLFAWKLAARQDGAQLGFRPVHWDGFVGRSVYADFGNCRHITGTDYQSNSTFMFQPERQPRKRRGNK